MNPPRYQFGIDHENIFKKLKLTFRILCLNSLVVISAIVIAHFVLNSQQINEITIGLKKINNVFFSKFNLVNLLNIVINISLQTAILEEFLFRYPILLLIKNNFWLKLKYNIGPLVIITVALSLNYIWAFGLKIDDFRLTYPHQIPWLIFITGTPLYWLVYKTKNLWPAIVCHALSNTFLFFLAQFLMRLKVI